MYSDRHVLALLLCAGMIALCCPVLCCDRGTAVVTPRQHTGTYNNKKNGEKKNEKKHVKKASKQIQKGSPTNNILVGNYRLEKGWEVGEYNEDVLRSRRDLSKSILYYHMLLYIPGKALRPRL